MNEVYFVHEKNFNTSFIIFCFILWDYEWGRKKLELDKIYLSVKSLPSSKPCENLEGYTKLKAKEEQFRITHYREIYEIKIKDYQKKCSELKEKKRQEELRLAEERRLETLRIAELNKTGNWKIANFVDEFGDLTGEKFLSQTIYGTFSNTATQDSRLRVRMFLELNDLNDPWFRFYEYDGSNAVKNSYGTDEYICKVKVNGSTFNMKLYQKEGWDYMKIDKPFSRSQKQFDNKHRIVNAIKNQESIKCSCYEYERSTHKFKFSFDFAYYENILRQANNP